MTLFEIDEKIKKCFKVDDTIIDEETGEIFDVDYLNELEMQRDQKIDNIAKWIKNLSSDIEQLKAQKDHFANEQRKAENKRDSLKTYLSIFLEGKKWDNSPDKGAVISFRKSEQVNIINESLIPKKWFIKQDPKLDKAGIKKELKSGKKVKGAELIENNNIQVR